MSLDRLAGCSDIHLHMTLMGLFGGRVPARLMLATTLFAAAVPAFALCAIQNEAGAIVYTNTPTNDGKCASSASPASRSFEPPRGLVDSTEPRFDSIIRNWAGRY